MSSNHSHANTHTNYLKTKTPNNNTRMNTYMGTVCNENSQRDMVCWMHHFQGNSNKTAQNKKLNVNFHHFIHLMMELFSRKDIRNCTDCKASSCGLGSAVVLILLLLIRTYCCSLVLCHRKTTTNKHLTKDQQFYYQPFW